MPAPDGKIEEGGSENKINAVSVLVSFIHNIMEAG